jgi:hypothetical protein
MSSPVSHCLPRLLLELIAERKLVFGDVIVILVIALILTVVLVGRRGRRGRRRSGRGRVSWRRSGGDLSSGQMAFRSRGDLN